MNLGVAAALAVVVGLATPALADEPQRAADHFGEAQPPGGGDAAAKAMSARADAPSSPGDAAKEGAAAVTEARRAVEDQRYDDALALLAPHLAPPDADFTLHPQSAVLAW